MTVADLYGLHAFGTLSLVHPETTAKYVNLNRHLKELESQDWFVAYRSSDRFFNQFNGDEASINNKQ